MSSSSWSSSRNSDSDVSSNLNETTRWGGLPIQVGDVDRNSNDDTCAFYALANGQKCRHARSCYDCLNTPVRGEHDGCVLMPQGFCQSMNRFDLRSDYLRNVSMRSASNTNGWYNFFASANATYCEPRDAACARCRAIADTAQHSALLLHPSSSSAVGSNTNSSSTETARQFCTGANGCVCVVACEDATWTETVAEQCPNDPFAPQQAVATEQIETYRALFPIFMCLQMALLGTVVYRRRLFARRRRSRAVAEGPYNNVDAITSPSNRLRLSGWQAARATQMQREKQRRMYLHFDTPVPVETIDERPQDVEVGDTRQAILQERDNDVAVVVDPDGTLNVADATGVISSRRANAVDCAVQQQH